MINYEEQIKEIGYFSRINSFLQVQKSSFYQQMLVNMKVIKLRKGFFQILEKDFNESLIFTLTGGIIQYRFLDQQQQEKEMPYIRLIDKLQHVLKKSDMTIDQTENQEIHTKLQGIFDSNQRSIDLIEELKSIDSEILQPLEDAKNYQTVNQISLLRDMRYYFNFQLITLFQQQIFQISTPLVKLENYFTNPGILKNSWHQNERIVLVSADDSAELCFIPRAQYLKIIDPLIPIYKGIFNSMARIFNLQFLKKQKISMLSQYFQQYKFMTGDRIFNYHEPIEHIYLIVTGSVKLLVRDTKQLHRKIILNSSDIIGFESFFSKDRVHQFDCVASSPEVQLYGIPFDQFQTIFSEKETNYLMEVSYDFYYRFQETVIIKDNHQKFLENYKAGIIYMDDMSQYSHFKQNSSKALPSINKNSSPTPQTQNSAKLNNYTIRKVSPKKHESRSLDNLIKLPQENSEVHRNFNQATVIQKLNPSICEQPQHNLEYFNDNGTNHEKQRLLRKNNFISPQRSSFKLTNNELDMNFTNSRTNYSGFKRQINSIATQESYPDDDVLSNKYSEQNVQKHTQEKE